ncbi:hypothetical protein, partial [Hymenobacter coccineus]|uniref:hypothetical protein n=1 Tax=Hymenobacter coccineus TaxID=1908235 RepID=UPI000AC6C8F6
ALVLAGLTATDGPLDGLLSNRALPLPHQTGYPLLLVPERLPAARPAPPALVLAGLTATDGPLDGLLSNRALPLPHQTGYPL